MEVLGAALAIVIGLCLLIAPFVALAYASGVRKRVAKLEADNQARESELRWLYDANKALEKKVAALEARPLEAVLTAPVAPADPAEAARIAADLASPTGRPPVAEAARHAAADDLDAPDRPSVADRSEDATHIPLTGGGGPRTPAAAPATAAPPPRTPTAPVPPKPAEPEVPFEQRLAAWLTRIGAGVALLGVLYFFKYAVDTNLIGPTGRVLVGVGAGVALLAAAEVLRKSTQAAFLQILVGLGLALLFASVWAGSVLYALIPITAGFVGNAVVLLVGAALAWHHRGQAILVLSLVATFANPVLLSTGNDRPLALFTYLLTFTGVMLAVAVRLRFAVAIAVAVLGVAIIWGGWYEKYFDIHDSRAYGLDLPPEELVGEYLALSTRLVPLLFVGLFSLEWLAAALSLHKGGAGPRWSIPLALAALLLTHAGVAALLPDQPLFLGIGMVIAGGIAIGSLHVLQRTDLLMVPMMAAFLILAVQLPDAPSADHTLLLALLGVWTSVYVVAFLRAAARENQTIARGPALRGAAGLVVFLLLAAFLLLPDERSTAFGLVTVAVALGLVALAHRAGMAGLAIAGVAGALLMLGFAVDVRDRSGPAVVDWPLLGTLALWSAVHVGGVVYGLARRRAMEWLDLATLSVATASLALLVFGATPDSVPTLRALVAALAGAVDLAVASWLVRARPELRTWVSILAAQALGLFAVAIALAVSGATVTLVWAALALVAALLWAEDRTPTWAVALAVLVSATLLRALTIDVGESEALLSSFRWSEGRQGVYQLTPIFNPRALALLGTGLSLLFSALVLARSAARTPSPAHRSVAGLLATLGHLTLIALCVSELRAYVVDLPAPPPMVLDAAEFNAFWETVDAARNAQYSKVNMVSTVTLAGAAMVLLAIGFAMKDAFHRYLGLAVFAGTLAKLIGWDVWNLARTYQIIVLTVVGALLLGSGFMYARLKTLFTGKGSEAVGAALLLALGLATAPSGARAEPPPDPLPVHAFAQRRAVEGIAAPGDHRVTIDLPLYSASLSATLFDDVRIVGPDGLATPHVIRTVAPDDPEPSREGTIDTPGSTADGGYRALFEVPAGAPHCRIELSIGGPSPYLRRVDVDAGETLDDLRRIASGGVVYSIDSDQGSVSRTAVRYPRSIARWVRVTMRADREARDTNTIVAARFVACAPERAAAAHDQAPLTVVETRRDPEARTTIVDLDAGAEGLPIERIVLDIETSEFVRRVDLAASSFKSAWPQVTSGYVYRVQDPLAPEDTTALALTSPVRKRWLRLTFHDRDDAPLVIRGATAHLTRREIVLRATAAGPHRLYVGDKAASGTRYDLADILARRSLDQPLGEAKLGPLEANPEQGDVKVPPALPLTEQHRGPIGIALGVVLLALAGWAVKLVRSGRE